MNTNINLSTMTSIWPDLTFTTSELVILQEHFSQPVVKKYLLKMASLTIQALATGGLKPGQTAAEYMIEEAIVKGGLDVLDKLMKFERNVESIVNPTE